MAIEFIEDSVSVDGKGSIESASVFIYKRIGIAKADVFLCGDFTLSESQELNQWQPIDENTPKDRDLLLLFEDIGAIQGKWSEFCLSHVPNELIYFKNRPTHWLALPSDPLSLPTPPAEAPDSEPHTPGADISPGVSKHG